jgi:hypothetical protein
MCAGVDSRGRPHACGGRLVKDGHGHRRNVRGRYRVETRAACTEERPRGRGGPFGVQSDIKNVRVLHGPDVILQFCGGQRFDEGHNIANCTARRA